jgi:hypothetical protein
MLRLAFTPTGSGKRTGFDFADRQHQRMPGGEPGAQVPRCRTISGRMAYNDEQKTQETHGFEH